MEILSIIFFALAAILDAVKDTLSHHYGISVFQKLNPKWWDANESWKHVKLIPYLKYRPDAWHLAKTGSLLFIILSIFFALLAGVPEWMNWNTGYQIAFIISIYGSAWIYPFNIFYNKILLRK